MKAATKNWDSLSVEEKAEFMAAASLAVAEIWPAAVGMALGQIAGNKRADSIIEKLLAPPSAVQKRRKIFG